MKKTALLIGTISLMIIAGCGKSQTAPVVPTTTTTGTTTTTTTPTPTPTPTPSPKVITSKNVTIANFNFSPASVQISAGGTVHRKNNDTAAHQIVADDNSFQSALLQQGDSFSFTFKKAGQFTYHCSIHPSMHGTIIVK